MQTVIWMMSLLLCPPYQQTIIHVVDWHYVSPAVFAADIRDQSDKPISDDEIDDLYGEFLNEVEAIQNKQMETLRKLIKKHDLKHIYLERFTDKNIQELTDLVRVLRNHKTPTGDSGLAIFLREQHRRDLLELGAAVHLVILGELKNVKAAEVEKLLDEANPVQDDGTIKFDKLANERREYEMVKRMTDKVCVIVLGGGHNLCDNVGAGVEVVRLESD